MPFRAELVPKIGPHKCSFITSQLRTHWHSQRSELYYKLTDIAQLENICKQRPVFLQAEHHPLWTLYATLEYTTVFDYLPENKPLSVYLSF